MAVNRASIVDQNFLDTIRSLKAGPGPSDLHISMHSGSRLSARQAIEIFESMVTSRHLDLEARALKSQGQSFYTIGSSGHEGDAAVAASCLPTDIAFLHYRSGAFFIQRARQVPGSTPM
ncbi:MAG: MFS transporter, partial [Myxococcota bacterium]|nr:MFS transporter [Myxococcota bacterium]